MTDSKPLTQSDAEPVAWKPDANMRVELDRSEMVARAMLKEIMKQIDYIEAEGHTEWHKRIHVNGELYLPDISAAVLASLYAAPPRPDALAQSNTEPDPTKVICPNCTHQFTAISVADQERLRAQPNAEPVAATSRSLLRPANQKQTICYCKPGECSAPKPEWCIGRRYADGFREAYAKQVAGHSTSAMRARIRELSRPDSDDYDRAVIAVLDDFEAALAQTDAEQELSAIAAAIGSSRFMDPPDGGDVSLAEQVTRMRKALERAEAALAPSNAEPVRVTDEMVKAASDVLFERTSIAFGGTYMREALEAALNPKQVALYTAPPRPDASAGLIEAAEIAESLKHDAYLYTATGAGREGFMAACYKVAETLRARATDRSGK